MPIRVLTMYELPNGLVLPEHPIDETQIKYYQKPDSSEFYVVYTMRNETKVKKPPQNTEDVILVSTYDKRLAPKISADHMLFILNHLRDRYTISLRTGDTRLLFLSEIHDSPWHVFFLKAVKAPHSSSGFIYNMAPIKVAPKIYKLAAVMVSDKYDAKEARRMAARLTDAWTLHYNTEGDAVNTLFKLGSPWPIESRYFRSSAGPREAMREMEKKLQLTGCIETAWEELKKQWRL